MTTLNPLIDGMMKVARLAAAAQCANAPEGPAPSTQVHAEGFQGPHVHCHLKKSPPLNGLCRVWRPPRRAIDFLQQRQQCDRAFAVRSTMTHSGQPRMNIRRCVLGAFLRDLSQAQQFFEGVESFGFVSLIAREDFGQNFGGALMGKPQGWNFRERQRSRRHVKGDCLEAQCRDWPYSVPARGEEADGGHCGRDGQIESRRTRDIDACRCGQVGQDHQTTWHHSGMTEIPEFAALLEEIVGSQHHRSFSVDWPFEELTRCSLLNRIAQPQKLIYSLICLHLMLAFKIVHRRGADRTSHCLDLIKHREINDHPIEVVAQYFASLQRHCKSSVLKRSDYAISAGLAQPAIAAAAAQPPSPSGWRSACLARTRVWRAGVRLPPLAEERTGQISVAAMASISTRKSGCESRCTSTVVLVGSAGPKYSIRTSTCLKNSSMSVVKVWVRTRSASVAPAAANAAFKFS